MCGILSSSPLFTLRRHDLPASSGRERNDMIPKTRKSEGSEELRRWEQGVLRWKRGYFWKHSIQHRLLLLLVAGLGFCVLSYVFTTKTCRRVQQISRRFSIKVVFCVPTSTWSHLLFFPFAFQISILGSADLSTSLYNSCCVLVVGLGTHIAFEVTHRIPKDVWCEHYSERASKLWK